MGIKDRSLIPVFEEIDQMDDREKEAIEISWRLFLLSGRIKGNNRETERYKKAAENGGFFVLVK